MGRKVKKVLFLINTLNGGGAEKVLIDTVNALDRTKYQITVQTVTDRGIFKDRLAPYINYKSIVCVKNAFFKRLFTYIINFILPPKLTHMLFIGNGYDCEIAFLEGVPAKIISASPNKNAVKYTWVHTDLYNNIFGLEKVHRNIQNHIRCYKRFDKIICVSESVKEAFIRRFGYMDNLTVKYNVVNDRAIKEKAMETAERSDKIQVVTVGRTEYLKGFDRLLKIHKRLTDEGFDYELVIVGDGSQRAELEEYTKQNSLSDSVKFIGFTDNPYKYMRNADLIAYPSRTEGYSTVAVEAVILGKPVVAADCSGMKEIFGNSEYGLVTDNADEAFYRGMRKMLSDNELREAYSQKAKIRSKDFSMSARIKELEDLF